MSNHGVLSYLNPKQYAARQIARDIIVHSKNKQEVAETVKELSITDDNLSKKVVAELAKLGYRISIDS